MTRRFILFLVIAVGVLTLVQTNPTQALAGWSAGRIIDDSIFTNSNSMNASQIQAFLNSKVPSCDTRGTQPSEYGGGTRAQWAQAKYGQSTFTCLKDYSETGRSAAQIIYDTAQKYQINPQVLIVLLQKEQSLVTDTWPLNIQYKTATGYGCPDTAPCDSQYYGLTNQLDWAGKMYRAILNNSPTWYTPYILGNNFIRYSPDSSCGGSNVYIQNRATQALYNYTPYQPSQAALNAGWGTVSCGAYGNRNFFLYFTSWFGSTTGSGYSWKEISKTLYTDATKRTPVDQNNVKQGQYLYVQYKVQNTGSFSWTNHRVTLARTQNLNSPFCTTDWIACNRTASVIEDEVPVGETGTIEFWMRAPNQSGYYKEYYNLLIENVAWFVDIGSYWNIQVNGSSAVNSLNSTKNTLKRGENLTSADGSSTLALTVNGRIELYNNYKKVWDAGVDNIYQLVAQTDGNLVAYTPSGNPAWVVNGSTGSALTLNDSSLTYGGGSSSVVWQKNPLTENTEPKGSLATDDTLFRGQQMWSKGGRYLLVFQNDGNLVLYGSNSVRWAINISRGYRLIQQGDGNLVVYDSYNIPMWATNRSGPEATTYIQDDGNIVTYGNKGVVWALR